QVWRTDHLAADQTKRRPLGISADRTRNADAGRYVHATADHCLLGFGAAGREEYFELQSVSFENAGALTEFSHAGVPQAALWHRAGAFSGAAGGRTEACKNKGREQESRAEPHGFLLGARGCAPPFMELQGGKRRRTRLVLDSTASRAVPTNSA